MRARTLAFSTALVLAVAAPAFAQLSGGVGSSNAANQSFQQQNAFRGLQQQQTFDNNQINGQIRSNRLYDNTPTGRPGYGPRRHR